VFLVALAARVVVALVANKLFDGALFQPDTLMYHRMAEAVAEGHTENWDEFTFGLFERTATFLLPLQLLYDLFSSSLLVGSLYVAVVGAATAAVVTLIARPALGSYALVPGGIVALLPAQVYFSAVTLKDAMVWLVYVLLALCVARARSASPKMLMLYGLGTAACLVLLAYTRQPSFVIACWAVAVTAIFGAASGRWARLAGGAVLCVTFPWIVGFGPAGFELIAGNDLEQMRALRAHGAQSAFVDFPGSTDQLIDKAAQFDQVAGSTDQLIDKAAELDQVAGSTDQLIDKAAELDQLAATTTEPQKAKKFERRADDLRKKAVEVASPPIPEDEAMFMPSLRHLPRGLAVMLFAPFPWEEGGSVSLNVARVESIVWYPILLLAGFGIPSLRRNISELAFPVVAGGATVIVYALTEGNIGTAYRHRGEFVWVIALLAGFGLRRIRGMWQNGGSAISA